MGSLILIEVATNESRPLSVDEIVNEYLAQPVETVENGNSDQDQVPDKPISPPLWNEVDEAIEILNRLTLFTTNLDLNPLHICLVTFISFISFTKVYLFIYVPNSNSFISISFILQIIVHLIHIHYIWFYSYCIIFQPNCVFHFFNQSRLWKLGVSLDKTLIRNMYCIIWSWTPMVLLLLVTS